MSDIESQYIKKGDKFPATEAMLQQLAACQRLALLGRLSIIISHEVNNQLTGVSGYAQLLLGSNKALEFERELGKILTSANRCQNLINKMRRIGLFGNGEKEFDNINFIIESALDLFRHQFEKRSLKIIENLSDKIQAIRVDTPALEQVFLNIVQNSFEALEEKGASLTITTSADAQMVTATFNDDGPGLSEEARANLFVPFFTTKTRLKCPGLGLTAAKTVIEEHGGYIEIDNLPAGGTSVKVALPVEPTADQDRNSGSK